MESRKIVVVGDGAVGKTCLLITYMSLSFPAEYVPMVMDNTTVNITFHDRPYSLSLWDTAGHDDYAKLRPLTYPMTDIFIIAFSVVNRRSFEHVKSLWVPELTLHSPRTPVVLVGTKIDLRDDPATLEVLEKKKLPPVTYLEGFQLSRDIGAFKYLECSALTQQGLRDVFHESLLGCTGSYCKVSYGNESGRCLMS